MIAHIQTPTPTASREGRMGEVCGECYLNSVIHVQIYRASQRGISVSIPPVLMGETETHGGEGLKGKVFKGTL